MVIELNIKKHLEKGYGRGELKDYKPWIKVNHFSSQGRSHRPLGLKTGRVHHLFSDLEVHLFNILDFSDKVFDIKEQYPLLDLDTTSIEETKRIATLLGIKHPQHQGSNIVMTTDFLITLKKDKKIIARTVKPYSQLSKRTLEKFEIERSYWNCLGIEWAIITDKELSNSVVTSNLVDLKESYTFVLHENFEVSFLIEFFDLFTKIQLNYLQDTLIYCALELDQLLKLQYGTSLRIIKYLMAIKAIRFDISLPIQKTINLEQLKLEFIKDAILRKSNLAE
jgi:hypothetical protein